MAVFLPCICCSFEMSPGYLSLVIYEILYFGYISPLVCVLNRSQIMVKTNRHDRHSNNTLEDSIHSAFLDLGFHNLIIKMVNIFLLLKQLCNTFCVKHFRNGRINGIVWFFPFFFLRSTRKTAKLSRVKVG